MNQLGKRVTKLEAAISPPHDAVRVAIVRPGMTAAERELAIAGATLVVEFVPSPTHQIDAGAFERPN